MSTLNLNFAARSRLLKACAVSALHSAAGQPVLASDTYYESKFSFPWKSKHGGLKVSGPLCKGAWKWLLPSSLQEEKLVNWKSTTLLRVILDPLGKCLLPKLERTGGYRESQFPGAETATVATTWLLLTSTFNVKLQGVLEAKDTVRRITASDLDLDIRF